MVVPAVASRRRICFIGRLMIGYEIICIRKANANIRHFVSNVQLVWCWKRRDVFVVSSTLARNICVVIHCINLAVGKLDIASDLILTWLRRHLDAHCSWDSSRHRMLDDFDIATTYFAFLPGDDTAAIITRGGRWRETMIIDIVVTIVVTC